MSGGRQLSGRGWRPPERGEMETEAAEKWSKNRRGRAAQSSSGGLGTKTTLWTQRGEGCSQRLHTDSLHDQPATDCCCCPVTKSGATLCSPRDCSMPRLPVHHQLPEFTQTHVHGVGDAIQLSLSVLSPSPPALNLSQHQGLV